MPHKTKLSRKDLIWPLFVRHGKGIRKKIPSMPGQFQFSIDQLLREIPKGIKKGIPAILLFGIPKRKDPLGKEAYADNGIIQQAVRAVKRKFPRLLVMTDLCFCEYTSHGHCGVLSKPKKRMVQINQKATLALIKKTALSQAKAGADVIAPSGMTVGAVRAIRQVLKKTKIMSYSSKFASAFYGPFRDAAGSAPSFGDRRGYQLDPRDTSTPLKKIFDDVKAGASMVMVKPALSYLDVMARAAPKLKVPFVAYNVSGEYAMVKAAGKLGWLDSKRVMMEILISLKRAGADKIITYHALDVAALLKN